MERGADWKASSALACYVTLFAGIIVASVIVAFIMIGLRLDFDNLPFPSSLLSLPVTEGLILGVTLLFARQRGANLKQLGLKKPKIKTLVLVTVAAFLLILLAMSLSVIEEIVLGPDPNANELLAALLPQDILQLVLMVGISILLVGPAEELAFRGFIQRGLENSFGKIVGLLFASVLFGFLHGLNSLRAIIPVTVISVILGYIWQKTGYDTTSVAWMHGLYDATTIALAYFATVYV